MIYRIPSSYYSTDQHPLITAWSKSKSSHRPRQTDFCEWLIRESSSDRVRGNFEDGWTIEFEDEAKYTWFLLKWG